MKSKNRYLYIFLLLELFLIFAMISMKFLSVPISTDEAEALYKCSNYGLDIFIRSFIHKYTFLLGQQPLFYLIGVLIANVFKNQIALRIFPVISWLVGLLFFYKLLKENIPEKENHLAFIFFLTQPFLFFYSVIFNRYSFFVSLVIINTYYFFKKNNKSYWITAIIMVLTHIYGLLLLFVHMLWKIKNGADRREYSKFALIILIMMFLSAPAVMERVRLIKVPDNNLSEILDFMRFMNPIPISFAFIFITILLLIFREQNDHIDETLKKYFYFQISLSVLAAYIISVFLESQFSIRDLVLMNLPLLILVIWKYSTYRYAHFFMILGIVINILFFNIVIMDFEKFPLEECIKIDKVAENLVNCIGNKSTLINISSLDKQEQFVFFIDLHIKKRNFNEKNIRMTILPDACIPYLPTSEILAVVHYRNIMDKHLSESISQNGIKLIDSIKLGTLSAGDNNKMKGIVVCDYYYYHGKYKGNSIIYKNLNKRMIALVDNSSPSGIKDVFKAFFSPNTEEKDKKKGELYSYKTDKVPVLDGLNDEGYILSDIDSDYYKNLKWGSMYNNDTIFIYLSFDQKTPVLLSNKIIARMPQEIRDYYMFETVNFFDISTLLTIRSMPFLYMRLNWEKTPENYESWEWEPGYKNIPFMRKRSFFLKHITFKELFRNISILGSGELLNLSGRNLYISNSSKDYDKNDKIDFNKKISDKNIFIDSAVFPFPDSGVKIAVRYEGKVFDFQDALKKNGVGKWEMEIKGILPVNKENCRLFIPIVYIPYISKLLNLYDDISKKNIGKLPYYKVIFKEEPQ